jgi:hypothetical protein
MIDPDGNPCKLGRYLPIYKCVIQIKRLVGFEDLKSEMDEFANEGAGDRSEAVSVNWAK